MAVSSIGVAPGTVPNRRLVSRHTLTNGLVLADFEFQAGVLLFDVSETGVGCCALTSPAIGATTQCQFDLPGAGLVQAVGTVAWSDQTGRFGLHFESVEDADRGRLTEWLTRERTAQSAPLRAAPGRGGELEDLTRLRQQLVSGRVSGDAAMQELVETLGAITGATGAAIAVQSGDAIVCRASYGAAPAIGSPVDRNSGLSGACLRGAEVIRCNDTETDPRVDRELCRAIELRSAVVVPVMRDGKVAGLVEVFSCTPHAFQNNGVRLLRRAAQVVSAIAWPAAAGTAEFPQTATPTNGRAKTGPGLQFPAVPLSRDLQEYPESLAALDSYPAVPDTGAMPAGEPTTEIAERRGRRLADLTAAQIAADPAAVQSGVLAAPGVEVTGVGVLSAVEPRHLPWRAAILVALAVVIAVLAWQLWPKAARAKAAPPAAAAAIPPVTESFATTPTAVVTPPPAESVRRAAPEASRPAAKRDRTPENAGSDEEEVTIRPATTPAQRVAAPKPVVTDAPPPVLAAATQPSNGAFSALLNAPIAKPVLAVSVPTSTGVTGGKLKTKITPVYPPAARALNVAGSVVLDAKIGTNGRVVGIATVSGHPLLVKAAEDAVRRWVYEPFLLNGKAVQTETRITIKFDAP